MHNIEKIKALLQQQSNDNFLQHALALEYIKIGDDVSAQTLFENILQHDEKYVGSYYHLAKLLERQGNLQQAILWYEKGMIIAKQVGDQHAYNELQAALEDSLP
jgi:Tfp pilus assembly protein PilF